MKRTLSVRLDEDVWDTLAARASEIDLTPSTLARLLIRDSLSSVHSPILASSDTTPPLKSGNQRKVQTVAVESALTPREAVILSKMAEGQTNQRIAHNLGMRQETIKKELAAIILNLSAIDRTHAVVMAIRQGHIHPESSTDRE
jgi:DNA-binding NarL/FixJ family response regulator